MSEEIRLNLGAGPTVIEGFTPIDRKTGREVYPLDYADNTVDEIRASHVLEHFSHRDSVRVLADWVRALKPGGIIKIAVPNFDALMKMYNSRADADVEAYLFGAHVDNNDIHLAMFNNGKLREIMHQAGLVDVKPWKDEVVDCAQYAFSLNLQGRKRNEGEPMPAFVPPAPDDDGTTRKTPKIGAVMSVPRLGFMDNFACTLRGLVPLGIPFKTQQGAFWGQCLSRAMADMVKDGFDTILTLDYDTIYDAATLRRLIDTWIDHPECDALAPIQCHRAFQSPLMTVEGENGKNKREIPYDDLFRRDVMKIRTAHFGLTLISVDALKKMPQPWFLGVPDPADGTWGDNRTDDDIYFWLKWRETGNTLYLANRVVIGHAELMVRWPGRDFRPVLQRPNDFFAEGVPLETWQ